jgi:hypothetical protein
MSQSVFSPSNTLTGQFAFVVRLLSDALFTCAAGGRLPATVYWLLNEWTRKHVERIRALIAALQDGTVRTRRSPAPGLTRARPAAGAADSTWLPSRRLGWLLAFIAGRQSPTPWLLALIEDPEMVALLAASPRLVRTMKPLCRALGVRLPKLRTPVPPVAELGAAPACVRPATEMPVAGEVRSDVAPAAESGAVGGEVARFAVGDARFRK